MCWEDKHSDDSDDETEAFNPAQLLNNDADLGPPTFLQIGGEHVSVTDEVW